MGMKTLYVSIVLMQCVCLSAFGQIAKIIETYSDVTVKKSASSRWQKAQPDMYLEREAEIKTGSASRCMLTFDEDLKNILTIEENSHIHIENVQPSVLYLPRGRVFSLIEDIAKIGEFKVRTPVAIAGVRGTGDSIEATKNGTTIKCFEGKIYAQLFDYYGEGLIERMVFEGLGVHIDADGQLGDMFFLDEYEYDLWNSFRGELTNSRAERGRLPRSFYEQKEKKAKPFRRKSKEPEASVAPSSKPKAEENTDKKQPSGQTFDILESEKDAFDDIDMLKEERRSDFQDDLFEKIRTDNDDDRGGSGSLN